MCTSAKKVFCGAALFRTFVKKGIPWVFVEYLWVLFGILWGGPFSQFRKTKYSAGRPFSSFRKKGYLWGGPFSHFRKMVYLCGGKSKELGSVIYFHASTCKKIGAQPYFLYNNIHFHVFRASCLLHGGSAPGAWGLGPGAWGLGPGTWDCGLRPGEGLA